MKLSSTTSLMIENEMRLMEGVLKATIPLAYMTRW